MTTNATTTGHLLRAQGLRKIYRGRAVVDDIDLELEQGKVVGLLGPNGAGKTTSFYMIVGFITPDGGKVVLDGRDISRLPMYKRARLGIGYLPQESSIFRQLTVEENIMAILQSLKMSRRQRQERLERAHENRHHRLGPRRKHEDADTREHDTKSAELSLCHGRLPDTKAGSTKAPRSRGVGTFGLVMSFSSHPSV